MGKKHATIRRILAIIGIVLLLSLYLSSLISAIFAKPYASGLFTASLFCTIVIPVLLYGFMLMYKVVHKGRPDGQEGENDEKTTTSIRKFKKYINQVDDANEE